MSAVNPLVRVLPGDTK